LYEDPFTQLTNLQEFGVKKAKINAFKNKKYIAFIAIQELTHRAI
jgi:hypothetical protein